MHLKLHASADAFLATAGDTLMRAEAANNLMLGVAERLASGHSYGSAAPYFITVTDGVRLRAAAVRTPPHPVILHCEAEQPEAVQAIVDHLKDADPELPGVNGAAQTAALFATLWERTTGARWEVAMRLRVFELRSVTPPTGVPGRVRPAQEEDIPVLSDWVQAFRVEAVPHDPPTDPGAAVRRFMDLGTLLVWDDDGPVSMAGSSRRTARGATVSLVYTPPALRGRGYASACVAALSAHLLDEGHAFCTLFTDLSNPTSNRIYQRIGYRPITDWTLYLRSEVDNPL